MPEILTETALRKLKWDNSPDAKKVQTVFHGGVKNLFVQVFPNNTIVWRYRYKLPNGKYKLTTLGHWPAVSSGEAVRKAILAKEAADKDQSKGLTIREASHEYLTHFDKGKTTLGSKERKRTQLSRLPASIQKQGIHELQVKDLREWAQSLYEKSPDTVHRTLGTINQLYDFLRASGHTERVSPAESLIKLFPPPKNRPNPYLKKEEIAGFLQKVFEHSGSGGSSMTCANLLLQMLLACRPSSLLERKWSELFLSDESRGPYLYIPAGAKGLKRRSTDWSIPLCKQAVHLFEVVRKLGFGTTYIFENPATGLPITETTVRKLIKTLGFDKRITRHGLRHTLSTYFNEATDGNGNPLFQSDVVERILDHTRGSSVKLVYDKSVGWDTRRKALAWWALELEKLSGLSFKDFSSQ